jgi:hypothetical protein
MTATSPFIFRPTPAQRGMAALLCAGSWLVGGRALVFLVQNLPRMLAVIKASQAMGLPTFGSWAALAADLTGCLAAGTLLALCILGLLLMEGTQVLVDELGLTVEHTGIPAAMSRALGSGRLPWKQIQGLEKGRLFFVVRGEGKPTPGSPLPSPARLRFLVVGDLERLVLLILERSPNLRFMD